MNGKEKAEIAKIVHETMQDILSQQAENPRWFSTEIPQVILHDTDRNCEGVVLQERIVSVRGHDLEDVVKKAQKLRRKR